MTDRSTLMHIQVTCLHAYARGYDGHWTSVVHNTSRSRKYLNELLPYLNFPLAQGTVRISRRTEASRW